MLKSTLFVGVLALALFAAGPQAAQASVSASKGVATTVATQTTGGFQTRDMEAQFDAYLAWTKAQGLSRLVAFEPRAGAADVLPNAAMRDAFEDYLKWAVGTGRSPYYAFTVKNFD
jgi:hypothetical protein